MDDQQQLWNAVKRADLSEVFRLALALPTNGISLDAAFGPDNTTALHEASANGDAAIVVVLLAARADANATDMVGTTPLHLAAEQGHWGVCKWLLDAGAVVDARDHDGSTALHYAAHFGHSKGHFKVARLLLKKSADVEAKTHQGLTALMHASQEGRTWIVQLLLLYAMPNLDARDNAGWTALIYASNNGHLEVIRLLMRAGADVNATSDDGWTALRCARCKRHSEVAQLLSGAQESGGGLVGDDAEEEEIFPTEESDAGAGEDSDLAQRKEEGDRGAAAAEENVSAEGSDVDDDDKEQGEEGFSTGDNDADADEDRDLAQRNEERDSGAGGNDEENLPTGGSDGEEEGEFPDSDAADEHLAQRNEEGDGRAAAAAADAEEEENFPTEDNDADADGEEDRVNAIPRDGGVTQDDDDFSGGDDDDEEEDADGEEGVDSTGDDGDDDDDEEEADTNGEEFARGVEAAGAAGLEVGRVSGGLLTTQRQTHTYLTDVQCYICQQNCSHVSPELDLPYGERFLNSKSNRGEQYTRQKCIEHCKEFHPDGEMLYEVLKRDDLLTKAEFHENPRVAGPVLVMAHILVNRSEAIPRQEPLPAARAFAAYVENEQNFDQAYKNAVGRTIPPNVRAKIGKKQTYIAAIKAEATRALGAFVSALELNNNGAEPRTDFETISRLLHEAFSGHLGAEEVVWKRLKTALARRLSVVGTVLRPPPPPPRET